MGNTQAWAVLPDVRTRMEAASNRQNSDRTDHPPSHRTLRFSSFEVDLESHELRKHGMRLRIAEKPFQILELLLDRAGQVVTRKALKDKLWPATHVGFEHSLNTAINTLRGLLGDSAHNPRFVETLPRVGYRFISTVIQPVETKRAATRKMLVVLPFENLSGSAEHDYFADGLTEETLSTLGQLDPRRLGVIARTSSMQYKSTKKSIAEIAKELNVDCVLEGSVRLQENRVRITAQLIETAEESHLWSSSFERELSDVLSVQAEVARAVGKALAFELFPGQIAKLPTSFPAEAHESYLRGRFLSGQRSEESLRQAVASFEHALSIEPNCARSYSGIADCLALLCWFGAITPAEAGPQAAAAATRALEIDDRLCEPHTSLGLVRFWYEWDWNGAEAEFLRATELNPSYAPAHHWYSAFLNTMGRLEEAAAALNRARELDPLSPIISLNAADPLFYARQFDAAIAHLRTFLDQQPRFSPALFNLGRACVENGMLDEAIISFEKAVQISGNIEGLTALAHAYALAGRTIEARAILGRLKEEGTRYIAAPMIARVHLGLGEIDQAFEWLNKGLEERSPWTIFLKMDPLYDAIRPDPRFRDLLLRAGL
jgi:TolB-like protein/Flp pilus assembly protein TadD